MFLNKIDALQLLKQNFFSNLSLNYSKNQIEIFRICISAFSIISLITLLVDYDVLLAPDGLIAWEVTNANAFWFELHPLKLSHLLKVDPNTIFWILISLYLLSLVAILLGVWTKGFAITALFCQSSFTTILSPYAFGVDIYQTVCLFLLCLFPLGHSLSLVNKPDYPALKETRQISIRLLQVYLGLTYLSAGIEKALMPNWWNGKFIHFLINDPTVISSDIFPKHENIWFYAALGISVVLLESTYFILMWIPRIRTISFFAIILMHLFIAFYMDLFFFGLLLIVLNVVCWYPAVIKDINKYLSHDKNL